MEQRLPIPIFSTEQIYTGIKLKKPTAKTLADTNDVINSAGEYMGFRNLIAGCTESIYNSDKEIVDPVSLKSLVFRMPNKTAEYTALQLVIDFHDGEDYVSGIYKCPLCGVNAISRLTGDVDTRDRLSLLKVSYMEEIERYITIQLSNPSIINVRGEELAVENLSIEFPTLEHHHKAYARYGNTNLIKYQLAIYTESLVEVNGQPISDEWRRAYGVKIFENMPNVKKDVNKLSDTINKYGMDLRVEKICKNCGEVWQPVINTSNFFGSALQLQ